MSSYDLDDNTILITGASSGIGRYFAELFLSHGCRVVLLARRIEVLESFKNEQGDGLASKIVTLAADVSDISSIDKVMLELNQQNISVDVLINNAGIADESGFLDTPVANMQKIMATNFESSWYLTQQVAKQMQSENRGGSIINIASVLATGTAQFVSAYAASKAAMLHASKNQALELARYGIRVNCIAPGYIETPLNTAFFATESGQKMIKRIPQRRLGNVEDLAGAVLLLASPLSTYMTGSVITVDGGHLCRTL